jgi:hypothetical protein
MSVVPSTYFANEEIQLSLITVVSKRAPVLRGDKLHEAGGSGLQEVFHEAADDLVGAAGVATSGCNRKHNGILQTNTHNREACYSYRKRL